MLFGTRINKLLLTHQERGNTVAKVRPVVQGAKNRDYAGKGGALMLMPFGKYRGQPLSELPGPYFEWLLTIDLRPPLSDAVWEELERRKQTGLTCPDSSAAIPADLAPALTEMVNRGYKAAAREHHPDVGGDGEFMRVLNAAKDWWQRHVPVANGGQQ